MVNQARIIFHIDMNSFYASVEIARHPEWRGKPLAIAGKPEERHGIVVTSSYEARKKGVRTTMTLQEARRKCPELIVKNPDFNLYRQTSDLLFKTLKSYTPIVEKASIDEGYLDLTNRVSGVHPVKLAEEIQKRIKDELFLPCSIGIAPNKFLAKMASNMKKPMGITVLRKRSLPELLWPMEIGKMHGVGPKTEERLKAIGIYTIGNLAKTDVKKMTGYFGIQGSRLHNHANGIDQREVDPEAWDRYKSIGQSTTLPRDTRSLTVISKTFEHLAAKLESRIKSKHVAGYELTVMIRYKDWTNVTKQKRTAQPLRTQSEIASLANQVFRSRWNGQPIRLLGITVSSFRPISSLTKQLDLFSYHQDARDEQLVNLLNKINGQFGENTLVSAGRLRDGMGKRDHRNDSIRKN